MMKHLKFYLFAVLTLFAASACSQNKTKGTMEKKKSIGSVFLGNGNNETSGQTNSHYGRCRHLRDCT